MKDAYGHWQGQYAYVMQSSAKELEAGEIVMSVSFAPLYESIEKLRKSATEINKKKVNSYIHSVIVPLSSNHNLCNARHKIENVGVCKRRLVFKVD